jgi:hypothetical protein
LAQKKAAGLKRAHIITQESEVEGSADTAADDANNEPLHNLYDLPQTVLSYGTVESSAMRRYMLEDILQCEVGNELLFLVSPHHVDYVSYQYIASLAPPLPLQNHRCVPFIQIKAVDLKNSRQNDLMSGLLMPSYVDHLLFGNGNGALCLSFEPTDATLEVLWKEVYMNPTTIHVWGDKPAKLCFYDVLKKMTNAKYRKGLFQQLATKTDVDRVLTIDLYNVMTKLATGKKNGAAVADVSQLDPMYLSLTNSIMELVSDFVDGIVKENCSLSFGHFISLSDPIVTHDEIDRMVEFTWNAIPAIWKGIQDLLGYSDAYKKRDSSEMCASK